MIHPVPAWVRRRIEARDAERAARWQARTGVLFDGLLPVDALWSNASLQPFCLACLAFAPAPVLEMGLPPETPCAHCGERVGGAQ